MESSIEPEMDPLTSWAPTLKKPDLVLLTNMTWMWRSSAFLA